MSTWMLNVVMVTLLLLDTSGEVIHDTMKPLPGKMTQLSVERECGKLSKESKRTWALPNGRESRDLLEEFMSTRYLPAVWLGIRRSSRMWQWVNGEKDERFKDSPGSHGCAVIGRNQVIAPSECADETQGFLCQMPGTAECKPDREWSSCTLANGKNYWFNCRGKNWFSGRHICRQSGGDLAVIANNQIKDIIQPLGSRPTMACTSFYIGLHREYWLRTTPGGDSELLAEENWAPNEPSNKDCALFYIDKASSTGLWRAEDCFVKHQGICERYNLSYEETIKPDSRNDSSCHVNVSAANCESQGGCVNLAVIALSILPVMTVAVVFVSLGAWFLYRRGKLKREARNKAENPKRHVLIKLQGGHTPAEHGTAPDQVNVPTEMSLSVQTEQPENQDTSTENNPLLVNQEAGQQATDGPQQTSHDT